MGGELYKCSEVIFVNSLPALTSLKKQPTEDFVVFYDRKLASVMLPWKKQALLTISLTAGERLKTLEQFQKYIEVLIKNLTNQSRSHLTFVAVGGGSVGDFVGFLASIFKRGVRLIHLPTTSLAAIDSAHGGKTALNILNAKNQIGTFYPADKIVIVKKILANQNQKLQAAAMGEFFKTCLLDKNLFHDVLCEKKITKNTIWKYLPQCIAVKNRIVKKDPLELSEIRKQLNLGHTFGHIIEVALKKPHGQAVGVGCLMAIEWSYQLGIMTYKPYQKCLTLAKKLKIKDHESFVKIDKKQCLELLKKDKKKSSKGLVQFVFLKGVGTPLIQPLNNIKLLKFAKNYGLVR